MRPKRRHRNRAGGDTYGPTGLRELDDALLYLRVTSPRSAPLSAYAGTLVEVTSIDETLAATASTGSWRGYSPQARVLVDSI